MEVEKAAREYAWKWFEYHAGQRQTVFRFFLAVVAAAAAGYLTVAKGEGEHFALWFGGLLIVLAFLFWRLDERSRALINCAEDYLREDEASLAQALHRPSIRISLNAHEQRERVRFPLSLVYTFRRVYALIFIAIALVGLSIILFDPTSPIRIR